MKPRLSFARLLFGASITVLPACSAPQTPPAVVQADAVADSAKAREAAQLAPQATMVARDLLAEAQQLAEVGRHEEAAIVGEHAQAAFLEAFALARTAKAQARIERAESEVEKAKKRLAELQAAQKRAEQDARAFEMRARVALDREEVEDVESLTPERARVRRRAAIQLASEADLLCLATRLLGAETNGLKAATVELRSLHDDLETGSVRKDLYPRAAATRAACLKQLQLARRAEIQKAPEKAGSDQLLQALTETGKVFAFRDDRGVVVNLRTQKEPLIEEAKSVIELLARTSQQYDDYPLLVVGHTSSSQEDKRGQDTAEAVAEALRQAGATNVTARSVGSDQPVVDRHVRGAEDQNQRVEIIFVAVAR